MRQQGRVALGYFPTPDNVVDMVARLFKLPKEGNVSIVDAGCGEGAAIERLRSRMLTSASGINVKCYGVEASKDRAEKANETFKGHGEAIWCNIEDASTSENASILWFNPPYDTIAGQGRLETILFQKAKSWVKRSGYIVCVLPENILERYDAFLEDMEEYYNIVGWYKFPPKEFESYKQYVIIGVRREKKITMSWESRNLNRFWTIKQALSDVPVNSFTIEPELNAFYVYRANLSVTLLKEITSKSSTRHSLLREAIKPPSKIERPLLPLKEGHLAMALAGGLCDGIVQSNGERFVIKGTLKRSTKIVSKKDKLNKDGEKTHIIETHRTNYVMAVRCLREDGTIENYSSHDDEVDESQEEVEVKEEPKEKKPFVMASESSSADIKRRIIQNLRRR